jgi:hypothetical protein
MLIARSGARQTLQATMIAEKVSGRDFHTREAHQLSD